MTMDKSLHRPELQFPYLLNGYIHSPPSARVQGKLKELKHAAQSLPFESTIDISIYSIAIMDIQCPFQEWDNSLESKSHRLSCPGKKTKALTVVLAPNPKIRPAFFL